MQFNDHNSNFLWIKYTKFYCNLFRFDIFIVRCLGGYFFGRRVLSGLDFI